MASALSPATRATSSSSRERGPLPEAALYSYACIYLGPELAVDEDPGPPPALAHPVISGMVDP